MDEILIFFQTHGLWLTLIAVLGIVILGILKYCGAFKKLKESYRHVCYLAISVGVSLIGSLIYLACVKQFSWEYIITLAGTIFALNQSAYAIYSTTSLKELFIKIIDWVKEHLSKGKSEAETPAPEESDTKE